MLYFINFLLIVFSGFYLTGILNISPIYFTTILAMILILINILYRKKIFFNKITIISIIIIGYILIINEKNKIQYNRTFSYIFNYIYIILIQQSIFLIKKDQLKKIVNYFFKFNLLLLVLELLIRLINIKNFDFSKFNGNKLLYYYSLKFNSIMYMDTNFMGMFILVILMLAVYLKLKNLNILLLKIIFLFTFCKAAIGVYFLRNIKKYWLATVPILMIVVIIVIKDPYSLLVRFYILNKYIDFLSNANLSKILFGVGLGNSLEAIGIGAHNILITNFLELGVFGSIFNFILWYLIYKEDSKTLFILIPFFIAGIIFAPTSTPYLYVACFIIIRMENKRNYIEKNM